VSFIKLFIEHTQEYESPTSFWKWSAIITIAAALRDSVWLPDGDDKLYPNDYVLFLAGSGARKGRPVIFSETLLSELGTTKIISGRSSIQGILDELARSETNAITGHMVKGGSSIFYAPELASGIVESPEAIGILTDIYDGKKNFSSMLRHSPKFKINSLVFTALMATNEEMGRDLITERAKKGGFLARTLLIVPDEFRKSNPLTSTDPEDVKVKEMRRKDLVHALREVGKLNGQMIFSPAAKERFDEWYAFFRNSYEHKADIGGVASRMHTHVKKIAMILSANDGSLELSITNIETSIELCVALIPNYNKYIMTTGKSTIAEAAGILIADLLANPSGHKATRKLILERHWNEIDAETLDKVVVTLEQAGLLKSTLSGGTDMTYELTQRMVDKMKGDK
jgi:hypothetical protein